MNKKILVADDDKHLVKILMVRFETSGYDVVGTHDGREALEKMKEENPDLAVLDIAMPELDGYALVKEMKADEALKHLPVIILTGKEQMEEIFKMEGIADYFVKPLKFEELLKKVEELLKPA